MDNSAWKSTLTPSEIHNRDVGRIVKAIVMPTIAAGGEFTDVLVMLESVVAGVLLYGVRTGGDDIVLDMLTDHVRERLQELRKKDPELGETFEIGTEPGPKN